MVKKANHCTKCGKVIRKKNGSGLCGKCYHKEYYIKYREKHKLRQREYMRLKNDR